MGKLTISSSAATRIAARPEYEMVNATGFRARVSRSGLGSSGIGASANPTKLFKRQIGLQYRPPNIKPAIFNRKARNQVPGFFVSSQPGRSKPSVPDLRFAAIFFVATIPLGSEHRKSVRRDAKRIGERNASPCVPISA